MRTGSWMMAVGLTGMVASQLPGCGNDGAPGSQPVDEGGTLVSQAVDFEMGTTFGQFDVEADQAVARKGVGQLGTGGIAVATGEIELDVARITVTPGDSGGQKTTLLQQADSVLEITIRIAAVDLVDSVCNAGEQHGPYHVALDADYVPTAIDPPTVLLSDATINVLNTGEFSLCIVVRSPVTGTVEIRGFTFNLSL